MADSRLHALLEEAERHLVNNKYSAAESKALQALQSVSSLSSGSEKLRLGDRAAVVLVQALHETNRFATASPCLCDTFGSLEDSPPNALLLWLSLSLDTTETCQSQPLILHLLQTKGNSKEWHRRQYIALLHLYLVEVLLPALRDPSQVRLWLQRQPFVPLDPRERRFLEDEIEAAAAQAAEGKDDFRRASEDSHSINRRRFDASNCAHPSGHRPRGPSPNTGTPRLPLHNLNDPSKAEAEADDVDSDDALSVRGSLLLAGGLDLPTLSPLSPQQSWRRGVMLSPAPSRSGVNHDGATSPLSAPPIVAVASAAVDDLDWLGRVQQTAFCAAHSAYASISALIRLADPISQAQSTKERERDGSASGSSVASTSKSPAPPPPPPHQQQHPSLTGSTVAGVLDVSSVILGVITVVVAYSAYTERASLRAGVKWVGREVTRGLHELVSMGTSLNPNPMAMRQSNMSRMGMSAPR